MTPTENSKTIADALLAEFNAEAETTRRFLEQLPADQLAWRPHAKSMTAGQLALHIAESPGGVVQMAGQDEFVISSMGRPQADPKSKEEIIETFEKNLSIVRETLAGWSDARMHETWRMTMDGRELLILPRAGVLRTILLNHWYHHRGQFGVYLRLPGAKVPSSYGPSGDEPPAFMR